MMIEKKYIELIGKSGLERDERQLEVIRKLQVFKDKIDKPKKLVAKILNKFEFKDHKHHCGVYIWGDVGRGKSMIMDLFYDSLETPTKLRVHFHDFIQDFHKSLDHWRKTYKDLAKAADPVRHIAKEFSNKYSVICFDELQVNNIADAMILYRLFDSLLGNGTHLFFTSNIRPSGLYKDGLQRERFLACIKLLEVELEVTELNNHRDYRLDKIQSLNKLYLSPLSPKNDNEMDKIISDLTENQELKFVDVFVDHSRSLKDVRSHDGVAVFTFRELCEVPYGAIDYLALCNHFNTIVIKNIPMLTPANHNEALRFITLIDCMYEKNTKLVCTAASRPELLYNNGKNAFEFQRTISRLNEMQSEEYVKTDYSQNW